MGGVHVATAIPEVHFTCFTGTQVQILTLSAQQVADMVARARQGPAGNMFLYFLF